MSANLPSSSRLFSDYFGAHDFDMRIFRDFGLITPEEYHVLINRICANTGICERQATRVDETDSWRTIVKSAAVILHTEGQLRSFRPDKDLDIVQDIAFATRLKMRQTSPMQLKDMIQGNGFYEVRKAFGLESLGQDGVILPHVQTRKNIPLDIQVDLFSSLISQTVADLEDARENAEIFERTMKKIGIHQENKKIKEFATKKERLATHFSSVMHDIPEFYFAETALMKSVVPTEKNPIRRQAYERMQASARHFFAPPSFLNYEDMRHRTCSLMNMAEQAIIENPMWTVENKVMLFNVFPAIRNNVQKSALNVMSPVQGYLMELWGRIHE